MKLTWVLSKEFIELVRMNITAPKATIIRIAERRFIFSNPKANEITIFESDVDRAIDIINNTESSFDRYASVYTWIKNNMSVVKAKANDMKSLWAEYRAFITARGIEWLWAVTGVYNTNTAVEKEFNALVAEVAGL